MSPTELFEALLALAREVGLEVRRVGSADAETSGACRLRERIFVLLAASDPLEQRIAVLARALRDHAGPACESRYLPPAVRAALEGERPERIVQRA